MDRPDIIELNDIYKPRFQQWLDEHHVRPTCPACDSPDYLLTMRVIPYAAPELRDIWKFYIRLCRHCGHMMQFDLGDALNPIQTIQGPSDAS